MKDDEPQSRRPWLDLERFRNARALGQAGCIIAAAVIAALATIGLLVQT